MFNLAALLLSGFLAGRCHGEDWSAFRGADGQGDAGKAQLPLQWGENENIAWKTELPGPGASSPVVHGRHVYVTCYSGFFVPGQPGGTQADLRRHLICVERTSGKVLWQRELEAKLPEEERIRDHGFAASTPACDAAGVVVFFGKTGVIAFDHEGHEKWRADVGSKTHGWGSSASPVLYRNMVLINASVESESLRALDRRTGREIWKVDGIKESWNTPVIAGSGTGRVELLLAGGRIYYLTREGRTIVVPAAPKFEELGRSDLRDGGQFNGSFGVDGNRLLVRSDRYLYAIGGK